MSWQLNFQRKLKYDSLETGIGVEALLRHGTLEAVCVAKVDTGSHVCLFERGIGEYLGFDITSGIPQRLSTLTGDLIVFGHEIILETLGLQLQTLVYFSEIDKHRNILGRHGWLQLIKLGLIDYDCELYISLYNE